MGLPIEHCQDKTLSDFARLIGGILPIAFCLIILLGLICGCVWQHREIYRLSDSNLSEAVKELVRQQPEEFAGPMTFMVIVDRSVCRITLVETPYWKDWQRRSQEAGWGFVMATSRTDSADLVITSSLDSVSAPVLVMPGSEEYVLDPGLPKGSMPMKLIVSPTGDIEHIWPPVKDTAACRIMTEQIDSVISNYASEDLPKSGS